jgi:hypothetical protein
MNLAGREVSFRACCQRWDVSIGTARSQLVNDVRGARDARDAHDPPGDRG